MIQFESLLSARLFMSPQRVGARLFFISNLSGRLSLYAMNYGGSEPEPVGVSGQVHSGQGEFYKLEHLKDDRYLVQYNIDGSSWGYEGVFDENARQMQLERVLWGQGKLSEGTLQESNYDRGTDSFVLSFSTATSPAQIYSIARDGQSDTHTSERVLGIPQGWLSAGEDASFDSFDGLRVSARLYLPAEALGFEGPRPLVYYLHGGPQSQERPDFTWFSIPLIQFLTLKGFAVFVPNARYSRRERPESCSARIARSGRRSIVEGQRDRHLGVRRRGTRRAQIRQSRALLQRHHRVFSAAVDGWIKLIEFLKNHPRQGRQM